MAGKGNYTTAFDVLCCNDCTFNEIHKFNCVDRRDIYEYERNTLMEFKKNYLGKVVNKNIPQKMKNAEKRLKEMPIS